MKTGRIQLLLIIGITFLVGYFFGVSKVSLEWKSYSPKLSIINNEPPASLSTVDFTLFWNSWKNIQDKYYDKSVVDPQKMLYGAISGMVGSLNDPYTMFLPPVQNNAFTQQMAGQFQGIGAELGTSNKQIIVVAPLDGSPAKKMGVLAGDTILKINNEAIDGWNIQDVVNKIRGPKGTIVALNILHKNAKSPVDISITRDTITVKSVVGWVKKIKDIETLSKDIKSSDNSDKSIAYIRLSQFGDSTNQDWSKVVNTIEEQLKKQTDVKGLVFDLRDNPGGYLTDATFVAGEFLPEGTPVVVQAISDENKTVFNVTRKGSMLDIPLIVLIDKGSASASEIVAGALRDNKRAKLVGDTSFGKGTIQEAMTLNDGKFSLSQDQSNQPGLHVTIAKWLTPNGTWVGNGKNGAGLKPDVSIAIDPKNPTLDTQLEKAIQELLK